MMLRPVTELLAARMPLSASQWKKLHVLSFVLLLVVYDKLLLTASNFNSFPVTTCIRVYLRVSLCGECERAHVRSCA